MSSVSDYLVNAPAGVMELREGKVMEAADVV